MNLLYLLILAQSVTGYNVGLFKDTTVTWQTNVAIKDLKCLPLSSFVFDPSQDPRYWTIAEGFVSGWTNETNANEYCVTPALKPTEPGTYDVKVRSVTTTASGTVYSAWVMAVPGLVLQTEPVVPCGVSGWYDWSEWSEWKPVVPRGMERKRTRERTVVIPGVSCPNLIETEVETQGIPEPVTATFVKVDTTTQGTWQGVYGKQGYIMAGIPPSPGPMTPYVIGDYGPFSWASSTTDVRALQKPDNPKDRVATTWYSPTSFVVDIKFNDSQQHQVAIYVIDYDDRGRHQMVETLDSMDNTVLPPQDVANYTAGRYLIYLVGGHVRFRFFNNVPGENSTASAVFIDPPSTVPINCSVSNWTEGVWGPWTSINSTTEQRQMTRTRTVLTPASGGGTACPPLTEVISETRPIATLTFESMQVKQCLVTLSAPPPPNTDPGWTANWYVDSGLFSQDPTAPYQGIVQVAVGSHALQVRWTRPGNRFMRMLRGDTSGAVIYDPVTFVCQ